jgi:hypothetical protein
VAQPQPAAEPEEDIEAQPASAESTHAPEGEAAPEVKPRRTRKAPTPAKGETKAARGEAKSAERDSTEGKTGKTRKERKSS